MQHAKSYRIAVVAIVLLCLGLALTPAHASLASPAATADSTASLGGWSWFSALWQRTLRLVHAAGAAPASPGRQQKSAPAGTVSDPTAGGGGDAPAAKSTINPDGF
jgi:hypothetical protein